MAKHLHFVSTPLHLHIQSTQGLNNSYKQSLTTNKIDPITHIAQIKGASLFNKTFFEILDNKSFKDPESQLKVYSKLVIDKQYIIEVCEHSGLNETFDLKPDIKSNNTIYGTHCFSALCIILWDIHCKDTAQATRIIKSYIEHYITQIFPNKKQQNETQEVQIKEISKLLYQRWGIKPVIKESFKTDVDSVDFKLIARFKEFHPIILISLKGKRLKITRKKSYKTLLELLRSEFYNAPQLVPKTK